MPQCPDCGRRLERVHRNRAQKLLFSEIVRCHHCGRRISRFHGPLTTTAQFVSSPYTRCIQCGTHNVRRLTKRDRIDWLSKHPLSWLFRLTGAPLNKCDRCRLQYYDWRWVRPLQQPIE